MDLSKILEKFKIKLEHEDVEKIKATVFVLAFFNIFLFFAATFFLYKGLFTLSYILSLGTIAYLLALFYETERAETHLLKKLEAEKIKRLFRSLIRLITGGAFTLMVFLLIIFLISLPVYNFNLYDRLLALIAIPILLLPLMFWSNLINFFKDKIGKGLLSLVVLMLLIPGVLGANKTNKTEKTDLGETAKTLESVSNILTKIKDFMKMGKKGMGFIQTQKENIKEIFGFNSTQASIFLFLLFLIAIFIALKIIRTLIKWMIILIIIWLVVQFLGIVDFSLPLSLF